METVNRYSVELHTTEISPGEPVERWFIEHADPVTAESLDLGTVFANWSEPKVHDITVEVGSSEGPSAKLRNAHQISVPAQSYENSSNLVVHLDGDLAGTAEASPAFAGENEGSGGGITGAIDGDAFFIFAERIGGDGGSPELSVAGALTAFVSDRGELSPDAVVSLGALIVGGRISGPMLGSMTIGEFPGRFLLQDVFNGEFHGN